MYYISAEPCEGDENVVASLSAIYGPTVDIIAATLRIYRMVAKAGAEERRPDAYLILAVATDVIPPELDPEAKVIGVVDPRRAESYHSLIVRNVQQPPSVEGRPLRVLPIFDNTPASSPNALVELPSCPVCLERLDTNASGLTSLQKELSLPDWPNDSCAVCSYEKAPSERALSCMKCGTKKSPWLCLVCGFTGCGRYVHFHAHRHYQDAAHRFSVDVQSWQIWDYVGDKFVHNIQHTSIQEEALAIEGKIHEQIPTAEEDKELLAATYESKLDAIVSEYKHLLDKQLESQQMYYEGQIHALERKSAEESQELLPRLKEVKCKRGKIDRKNAELEKESKTLAKKIAETEKQSKRIEAEHEWMHSLNDAMIRDQAKWRTHVEDERKKLSDKEKESEELSEKLQELLAKMT